ncbi:MAG: ATP-binding protein [Saprospiraceae bacterium]
MSKNAYFKVDTKLAELLGETYRSIEFAIKELVDNAFDADSENVKIQFPNELNPNPIIVVSDDGTGMKENEVRSEYLNVANSRTSRKGSKTRAKGRKGKGRKGIGKFAGLMIADLMILETFAGGKKTILSIDKTELAKSNYDLEKIPLPISSENCLKQKKGTKITLQGLNQNLHFPNPERMKEILMWEYGRELDFDIYINGQKIGVLDLQGKSYSKVVDIGGKKALVNYTITNKPIKQAGLVTKVGGKAIGRPINFLKDDDLIPKKLQNRVYGEIICDDLEDDVTADWGAIVENSKLFYINPRRNSQRVKNFC